MIRRRAAFLAAASSGVLALGSVALAFTAHGAACLLCALAAAGLAALWAALAPGTGGGEER